MRHTYLVPIVILVLFMLPASGISGETREFDHRDTAAITLPVFFPEFVAEHLSGQEVQAVEPGQEANQSLFDNVPLDGI